MDLICCSCVRKELCCCRAVVSISTVSCLRVRGSVRPPKYCTMRVFGTDTTIQHPGHGKGPPTNQTDRAQLNTRSSSLWGRSCLPSSCCAATMAAEKSITAATSPPDGLFTVTSRKSSLTMTSRASSDAAPPALAAGFESVAAVAAALADAQLSAVCEADGRYMPSPGPRATSAPL